MEYNIIHNEEKSRFETEVEGLLSLVDYRKRGNVFLVTHTEVPLRLEGRGIAAALTKALLDHIRKSGYKVCPICPYTKIYIQRHPEYEDIVAEHEE
ncbi:N-acetyltransferase [Dysgonomonas sp. Marseille-P4677]|uniref:GNAT family N-acetyltransferase n=1 Tax=Dysgonomonas sp. Marseille-P4677 TaxID=2364790 RepID=UPI0019146006|nr:GNAT family N-acetyltransferase [Dysgonomonas sp. Marseille-P4677]MBK5720835.1 N-acetyltransferase [Dysgonomonas sp. Marseille-P4677]